MKNPLLWKAGVLLLLVLVLMIPLAMVQSASVERQYYLHTAAQDVSVSWGGEQVVSGPFIVQNWEEAVESKAWDRNLESYVTETHRETRTRIVFPDDLEINGNIVVERRKRGLYEIPVYRSDLDLQAVFDVPAFPEGALEPRSRLAALVTDPRGFRAQPAVQWQGAPVMVAPGVNGKVTTGVHADLDRLAAGKYTAHMSVALAGSNRLGLAPIGGDTRIALSSNWPHPGFGGGYLPDNHVINGDGFTANWRTSIYATTARELVSACPQGAGCLPGDTQLVSLYLADPVNVYVLNDRAGKHGLLFILVIFGVFLLYEVLKRLRIHPVQYALVGLAQAMFFLLLLSLSEHIAFGLAYLAGASACAALLAFYVSHVLGSLRRGLTFGALIAVIYGALYVILLSEDHALLLGTLLLFALLSTAMYLTRRIDWYGFRVPGGAIADDA